VELQHLYEKNLEYENESTIMQEFFYLGEDKENKILIEQYYF